MNIVLTLQTPCPVVRCLVCSRIQKDTMKGKVWKVNFICLAL